VNSETSGVRAQLAEYCRGCGLDIGAGGDPIVRTAICLDLERPYTKVGSMPQHLAGHCRDLRWFRDGVLDYVYSSHLIEDFTYADQVAIVREWRRVLRPGGLLVLVAPDQPAYLAHCKATGQAPNRAHKIADYCQAAFLEFVMLPTGPWRVGAHSAGLVGTYSWWVVLEVPLP
jgi:predicted SAM-dependent methyltransferase